MSRNMGLGPSKIPVLNYIGPDTKRACCTFVTTQTVEASGGRYGGGFDTPGALEEVIPTVLNQDFELQFFDDRGQMIGERGAIAFKLSGPTHLNIAVINGLSEVSIWSPNKFALTWCEFKDLEH